MKGFPRSLAAGAKVVSALLAVVGVASVMIVLGANFGVAFATDLLEVAIKPSATADAHEEKKELPSRGIMYSTAERIVNLADKGTLRYLKTLVVVELARPGDETDLDISSEEYKKKQEELRGELVGRSVIIEDEITMILSSKTATELVTPEGKVKVKQELKERLNELVGDRHVLNVYFTQFIIQ